MHVEDQSPKLIQPQDHKAQVILWDDLTVSDVDYINEARTFEQVKSELARIFSLEDYEENMKSAVLLDLYAYTIQFCRENNFSREQISAFFSMVKKTHEMCVETPFGNVDHCFHYFRELLLCHSVKRSPFSLDLFSPEEVRKITTYVVNTYFRHFKMYKYMFTPLVRLDLTMNYIGMLPTPPPSVCEDEEAGAEDGEKKEDGEKDDQLATDIAETKAESEQSLAAKELRELVQKHLSDELKKLRRTVEDQIKESDTGLNKKLTAVERGASGKQSSRSKRK